MRGKHRNVLKKTGAFLLALCMVLLLMPVSATTASAWDGTSVDTSWYAGHESDTSYTIGSAAALAGLAKLVNEGNGIADDPGEYGVTFENKTITLTADIDLSNYSWAPIGQSSHPFNGCLNGDYHVIEGLNVDVSGEASDVCAGLIGYISGTSDDSDGKYPGVTKLVVKGTVVGNSTDGSYGSDTGTGGIVGATLNRVGARLYYVGFEGSVTGVGNAGGILGILRVGNSVAGCYNRATVTATASNGYAGGIVGAHSSGAISVISCYNTGSVSGVTAAGIIPETDEMHPTYKGNYNAGTLSGTNVYGTVSATNDTSDCYYLTGCGASDTASTAVDSITVDLMSTNNTYGFVEWAKPHSTGNSYNSGYPVFVWETLVSGAGSVFSINNVVTAFDALDAAVASQNVANGTALSQLNLPTTLTGTVDGTENTTISAITWKCSTEYSSVTAGDYEFTAVLPDYYGAEPESILPVITVTVSEPAKVSAFNAVAAISVAYGTALADLNLPTELTATVDEVADTSISGITWTDSSSYTATTPGDYTFTAALPIGYELVSDVTLATITVTVEPMPVVSSFNALDSAVAVQSVSFGTALGSLSLPTTLTATVDEAADTSISSVTWTSSPTYSATTSGDYTFTAVLPDGYELAADVALPTITVTVEASPFAGGDGLSEETAFEISTPAQLALIATWGTDKYYKLVSNIDMTDVTWTIIDEADVYWTIAEKFTGTLDGDGHTIKNYTATNTMFDTLTGTIKNLTLSDVNINVTTDFYGAGIANFCNNGGVISNCAVTGVINVTYKTARVGGIVGKLQANGTVSGCYSNVNITADSTTGTNYAGGIAAYVEGSHSKVTYNYAVMSDCYSAGKITATSESNSVYIGGITGYLSQDVQVNNCYTTAALSGTTEGSSKALYMGGFSGNGNSYSSMDDFFALNSSAVGVSAYKAYVGQIAGGDSPTGGNRYATVPMQATAPTVETKINGSYISWADIATGTPFASWDSDVWNVAANSLPSLKGISAETQVSPDVVFGAKWSYIVGNDFSLPDTVYALKSGVLTAVSGVTWGDDLGNTVTADDIRSSEGSYILTPVLPGSETTVFSDVGKSSFTVSKYDLSPIIVGVTKGAAAEEVAAVLPTSVSVTLNGENLTIDNVTWETTETVDTSTVGTIYKYTLKLPEGYQESEFDLESFDVLTLIINPLGSGTESDPYLISDAYDLLWMRDNASDNSNWSGVYFKQTADIDLSGTGWTATLGTFAGTYDGVRYEIQNLSGSAGLFGTVSGKVTNLGMTNAEVDCVAAGSPTIGVLANSVTGTVSGCYATGELTVSLAEDATAGTAIVGGLIGKVTGTVGTCYAKVDITSTYSGGTNQVGGLIGSLSKTIQYCFTDCDITVIDSGSGAEWIGGLIGYSGGLDSCYSRGSITVEGGTVRCSGTTGGGGSGYSVMNCYSAMTIEVEEVSGTIAGMYGYVSGSSYSITNCVALNPYIVTRGTQNDRIAHYVSAMGATDFSGNYAIDQMNLVRNGQIYTVLDSQKAVNGSSYGADVSVSALNSVAFASWSTDDWTIKSGKLPVLKAISSTVQDSTIPTYTTYDTTIVPDVENSETVTVPEAGETTVAVADLSLEYSDTDLVHIYLDNQRQESVIVTNGEITFTAEEAGDYVIEKTRYVMSDFYTAGFAAQYTPAVYSGSSSSESPGLSISNAIVMGDESYSNALGGSWKGYGNAYCKKAVWTYEDRDSTTGELMGYVIFDGEAMEDVAPIGPVDAYLAVNPDSDRTATYLSWHTLYTGDYADRATAAQEVFAGVLDDSDSILIAQPFMRQFKYNVMTYGLNVTAVNDEFQPGDQVQLTYLLGSYNLSNYHSNVPTVAYALEHEMDWSKDDAVLTVDENGMIEFDLYTGGFFSLTKVSDEGGNSGTGGGSDEDTSYTVTFDTGTRTAADPLGTYTLQSLTVSDGDTAEEPPARLYDGNSYAIVGWYTDSDCTKEFDFSTPIEGDTTLYAKWMQHIFKYEQTTTVGSGTDSAPWTVQLADFIDSKITWKTLQSMANQTSPFTTDGYWRAFATIDNTTTDYAKALAEENIAWSWTWNTEDMTWSSIYSSMPYYFDISTTQQSSVVYADFAANVGFPCTMDITVCVGDYFSDGETVAVSYVDGSCDGTVAHMTTAADSDDWTATTNIPATFISDTELTVSDGCVTISTWHGGTFSLAADESDTDTSGGSTSDSTDSSSVTEMVTVTATTDGSTASASVTADEITSAIAAAKEAAEEAGEGTKAGIAIEVDGDEKATTVEIIIPSESIKAVAAIDMLTVTTAMATVTFDEATLDGLAAETGTDDVTITIEQVDVSALSQTAQDEIGDRPVFSFSVTSGSSTISEFDGLVTVSIPYTPAAGEDPEAIVIYYMAADGTLQLVKDCVYDEDTASVIFITTHFSEYAVGYNEIDFDDVTGWYEAYVTYLSARGIINGKGDRAFAPSDSITRAEFAQILANMSGAVLTSYTGSSFEDVDTSDWYCAAVQWAYENGIVTGYDGSFNPNDTVTRQDLAVMLTRYAENVAQFDLPETVTAAEFADEASIAGYAEEAVTSIQKAGIISGRDDGTFDPQASATRAEAAKMIALFMQLKLA